MTVPTLFSVAASEYSLGQFSTFLYGWSPTGWLYFGVLLAVLFFGLFFPRLLSVLLFSLAAVVFIAVAGAVFAVGQRYQELIAATAGPAQNPQI